MRLRAKRPKTGFQVMPISMNIKDLSGSSSGYKAIQEELSDVSVRVVWLFSVAVSTLRGTNPTKGRRKQRDPA